MKHITLACALMLVIVATSDSAITKESYEYPGRWKVLDQDKKEYSVLLNLGGSK